GQPVLILACKTKMFERERLREASRMNGNGAAQGDGVPSAGERIGFDELVAAIESKLTAAGASPAAARVLASNCAACDRDGTLSHGGFRGARHPDSRQRGRANGSAEPDVAWVSC